jgi:hypothetical protein
MLVGISVGKCSLFTVIQNLPEKFHLSLVKDQDFLHLDA